MESEASNKAATLLALYRDVSDFPEPDRSQLRVLLADYCRHCIDVGWPVQRQGVVPLGGLAKVAPIRAGLLAFEPEKTRDRLVHADAFRHFQEILEHGRSRRYAAEGGNPTVMWYVVIVGTIINFILMWMFDMRFVTQLVLGGLLAFFLGTLILLIAVLERPYRSPEFGVSPKAHMLVLQVITNDLEGGSSGAPQEAKAK